MRASIRRVANEIQRYCSAHPDARDSIEGIAWWVQMQRQEDFRAIVADAVHMLVQRGFLQQFKLQDGSKVFGLKYRSASQEDVSDH